MFQLDHAVETASHFYMQDLRATGAKVPERREAIMQAVRCADAMGLPRAAVAHGTLWRLRRLGLPLEGSYDYLVVRREVAADK